MTVKTTRVILDRTGDLEAERNLIPFAKNQQFILQNLMGFQGLMQDQRIIKMLDGSVISIRSSFGEDVIRIKSPYVMTADTIEVPVIPSECDSREFIFIIITADNTVELYRYDNLNPSVTNPVLWQTINVHNSLSVPIDPEYVSYLESYPAALEALYNIDLMYAESDINSFFVQCTVWDWRGNTAWYDPQYRGEPPTQSWLPNALYTFPVKIPIDFLENDKISSDIVGQLGASYPNKSILSQSGLMQFISADGVFRSYNSQPINKFQASAPWARLPMTNNRVYYAMGACGDYLVIVCDESIPGSPATFAGGHISLYNNAFWQGEEPVKDIVVTDPYETGGTSSYLRRTSQVLIRDDKIFVFFDTRTFYDICSISVTVYDLELNVIKANTVITGIIGNRLSRVSIVNDGVTNYICFRTASFAYIGYDVTGFNNPVYLVDVDTLKVVKTISLPANKGNGIGYYGYYGYYGTSPAFAAVTAPISLMLLDKINTYRFEQSGYYQFVQYAEPYTMPISYLGYSCKLEQCARLHAIWLVSQRKMQHEDVDGNLVYDRGVDFGFRRLATGENLALIDTSVFKTEERQIDEALRLWKESPGHNLNLVNRDLTCMGYATAVYPASVNIIYIGDGMYNPTTHSYSSGITHAILSSSQYGKMKLFVLNVAEG